MDRPLVTAFSDDFNRTDAANLGSNWTSGYTSGDPIQVLSNVAAGTTNGTDAVETVNSVSIANDQWAQVTISAWTSDASTAEMVILLRYGAGAAQTGYEVAVRQNGSFRTRVGYRIGGTLQAGSVSENAINWAAGDVLYAEIIGTTINTYRNGVSIGLPFTDANLASGRVGLRIHPGNSGPLSSWAANDFSCGYFANVAGVLVQQLSGQMVGQIWN